MRTMIYWGRYSCLLSIYGRPQLSRMRGKRHFFPLAGVPSLGLSLSLDGNRHIEKETGIIMDYTGGI